MVGEQGGVWAAVFEGQLLFPMWEDRCCLIVPKGKCKYARQKRYSARGGRKLEMRYNFWFILALGLFD